MPSFVAVLAAVCLFAACAGAGGPGEEGGTAAPSDPAPAPVMADDSTHVLSPDAARALAIEHLGTSDGVEVLPDASGRYVLLRLQREETPRRPVPAVSYVVWGVDEARVVYAERGLPGTAAWSGPHRLRVDLAPGTVSTDPADNVHAYEVDVAAGQRLPAARTQR